jgi:transposase
MGYITGESRDQAIMFPSVLDDYITEDNLVRFLDAFIESLDLKEMGFEKAEPRETGRPPYDPRDLLKLYIYGYLNRIRTSRKLETEAGRNVELMWLIRKLRPDFKTIADFRKDNREGLTKVYKEFNLLCRKLGMFGGELVSVDGSKFKAWNSKDKNYTIKKLEKLIERLDERIDRYLKELDEGDQEEADEARVTVNELKEKIERMKEMKKGHIEKKEKLEKNEETQISLTDPDSRLMKTAHGGSQVSYNVQMAVDSKHKMIVVAEATNKGNDQGQLAEISKQAKEEMGVEKLEVVADGGYYDSREVKECADNGITVYMERPKEKKTKEEKKQFGRGEFKYNAEKDVYVCPVGEELTYRTTEKDREQKRYQTEACAGCAIKAQCTEAKGGRIIKRSVHEELLEEMAKRVKNNPSKLGMRKGLAEHPFGTVKRWFDQGYFLLRGKEKVGMEVKLTALVYNMKRAFNVMGVEKMMEALG